MQKQQKKVTQSQPHFRSCPGMVKELHRPIDFVRCTVPENVISSIDLFTQQAKGAELF